MKKPKKQHRKRQTKASLAARLGLSRSTLHEWKAKGCPVDEGDQAVLSWAMSASRRGFESDDIRVAKLEVLTETGRRLKLANDAKQDLTILKTDVQAVMAKAMALLFAEMERKFSLELPPALKGLGEVEIQKQLLDAIMAFKETLRGQWSGIIEEKS